MIDYKSPGKWSSGKHRTRLGGAKKIRSKSAVPAFQRQTQNRKAGVTAPGPARLYLPQLLQVLPKVALMAVVVWMAVGLVRETSSLLRTPLTHVELAGTSWLGAREVLSAAGIGEGIPLVDVDPYTVAQDVTNHPGVESASVRRVFPGQLRVTILERAPFAVVTDRRASHVVISREGIILRIASTEELASDRLPRMILRRFPAQLGHRLTQPALHEGIEMVRQLRRSGLLSTGQSVLDLTGTTEIAFSSPDMPYIVLMPATMTGGALKRLAVARQLVHESGGEVRTLDLRASAPLFGGRLVLRK